jgi:hypothetical protein
MVAEQPPTRDQQRQRVADLLGSLLANRWLAWSQSAEETSQDPAAPSAETVPDSNPADRGPGDAG